MTTSPNQWDASAATYDNEPDHGLADPDTRAAWSALLATHLPDAPADILDAGCGTGSLTLLMRQLGHRVTGIDASPSMLDIARAKLDAARLPTPFHLMDASRPDVPAGSFDVVLSRHVLWMFDDLPVVLDHWLSLLRPGGRLLLIEGFWHTGGGLHAKDLLHALDARHGEATLLDLSEDARLWGGEVTDERYIVVFSTRSL